MTRKSLFAVIAMVCSGFCTNSLAALIEVNADGMLVGASGVEVNGLLYDVVLQSGTCVDIFDGCDELSDFTFTNGDANAAANALLNQVFVDVLEGSFDTDPYLTCGGSYQFMCTALIPSGLVFGSFGQEGIIGSGAMNVVGLGGSTGSFVFGHFNDSSTGFFGPAGPSSIFGGPGVYARFTALSVPEPPSSSLLAAGLMLLALSRRVRRRNHVSGRSAFH